MVNHNQSVVDIISNASYTFELEYVKTKENESILLQLVEDCTKEPRTDRKIEILCRRNSMLLKADQLDLSVSLLRNDYINMVLNRMEEIP